MNIYVSRDGQTFGPYTREQANQFIGTGQLLATDFALYEGESEWKSLGVLLGIPDANDSVASLTQAIPASPQKSVQSRSTKVGSNTNPASGKQVRRVKMNSGKSVVIAKEKSLVSRIISTLIVFSVTCGLACGVVVGLYFAFPSKVSPILQKFGIVSKKVEATEVNRVAAVQQEPTSALEITLNEEDWQRLRSTDIIILPMDKGDGFRILSPPEKKRGLNDQDLDAIVPLSGKILSLDLTHAEISDEGLKLLSKLSSLQRLYLEGNKEITVDGLAHLKSLEKLTYLNLVRIELNEELVDLLISMKSLREIYLYDTGLNEDSITRLTDARPKVFVNGG